VVVVVVVVVVVAEAVAPASAVLSNSLCVQPRSESDERLERLKKKEGKTRKWKKGGEKTHSAACSPIKSSRDTSPLSVHAG
jgi:hypothetical protein